MNCVCYPNQIQINGDYRYLENENPSFVQKIIESIKSRRTGTAVEKNFVYDNRDEVVSTFIESESRDSILDEVEELINSYDNINIPNNNRKIIFEYAKTCNDLEGILLYSLVSIIDKFSSNKIMITLDIDKNPLDDSVESLVIIVSSNKYDDTFIKTLDEISESFEEDLPKTNGWLYLTTDFRKIE